MVCESSAGDSAKQPPRTSKAHPSKAKEGRFPKRFGQPLFFAISVVSAIGMFYYHRTYMFLPSVIVTKCSIPTVMNHSYEAVDPSMFWGTYRANLYIGMGGRSPLSPLFGVMWYLQAPSGKVEMPKIRHWCNQGDHLTRHSWEEHDGKIYGIQQIVDHHLQIKATMVKSPLLNHPGNWAWRIETDILAEEEVTKPPYSFIFYMMLPSGDILKLKQNENVYTIEGETEELKNFRLHIIGPQSIRHSTHIKLRLADAATIDEEILKHMRIFKFSSSDVMLLGLAESEPTENTNFIAVQVTLAGNTRIEVAFESLVGGAKRELLTGELFDSKLSAARAEFEKKFEAAFQLEEKKYAEVFSKVGKHALSSMLGGLSYFHGRAIVQSVYNSAPVLYGPLELFSTVPSKSFFPRGFLWDEGFHQLLLRHWDVDLSLEIMGHWLDLMNVEGWIPREVILGTEALRKVPWEFVTQRNTVANPPVFFYTLNSILKDEAHLTASDKLLLKRMFPRLKLWYRWLNSTQAGSQLGTFRWRGRNETTNMELNPKTLPSGLDDFPRASHPTQDEYHVDLFSWMLASTNSMIRMSKLVNDDASEKLFREYAGMLTKHNLLDQLHWSDRNKRYCDYGLHTGLVALEEFSIPVKSPDGTQRRETEFRRVVKGKPKLRLVSDVFGYVNLFPLFLRLLPRDSPKLEHIFEQMTNPELLWTPYGLRSLSKSSRLYMKRNTEHDPPYWRGAVWINMNYMALSSLHYYSQAEGPYRQKAFDVYNELRNAVVSNVVKQYVRTGYLWEHYNDVTGEGEGSHPFSGWTSLVLLMMAELYE
ncbi:mannosyl oligosaccharide glucosidase [Trichuris trichiura]|uniref:Mannosyl-oligosaccharide glucosidase n=1 Tax=Trichuris trichiura TaxID=36087 RepID=A0A077Z4K9_TRITR|nr:mannosyl oligosaccharide glucosidase [Trichuris trichiura]